MYQLTFKAVKVFYAVIIMTRSLSFYIIKSDSISQQVQSSSRIVSPTPPQIIHSTDRSSYLTTAIDDTFIRQFAKTTNPFSQLHFIHCNLQYLPSASPICPIFQALSAHFQHSSAHFSSSTVAVRTEGVYYRMRGNTPCYGFAARC